MDLSEQGIKLKTNKIGNHKTVCPKCSHTRKKKSDPCLSVKLDPHGGAVWKCHNCGWSGSNKLVYTSEKYNKRGSGTAPTSRVRSPKPIELPKKPTKDDKLYQWFLNRGIGRMTVDSFGIYKTEMYFGDRMEPCIAFPYFRCHTLFNIKYRTANKKFRQEKDARKQFYMSKELILSDQKELIIVEGEMDVLSLYQCGFKNVISLPDGAPQKAEMRADDKRFQLLETLDLDRLEKVIIAVDMDEAGQALATELEHRLGKDICWRVSWPDSQDVTCKDANETLLIHGTSVVVECIESAKPNPIAGVFNANEYMDGVLDLYYGRTAKPLSTGFSELDELYKVMPATFNVVTGVPNHGKSNFLDQIIINMAEHHDWKFAVFSPEHSTQQHLRRLVEKRNRKPFDDGPTPRMSEAELRRGMDWLDGNFHFIESGDHIPTIDYILDKAKRINLRHGIDGLVIDPFNKIDASRESGKREDEHIRDLIAKCQQFGKYYNVTVWMVAHPHKMYRTDDGIIPPPDLYQIAGSAHWNNMCDVGMVVHRDFETNETRVIMRKIREQGVYGNIGECFFTFNTTTRSYEQVESRGY